MPRNYWNGNYWGVGAAFTQVAHIGFSMLVDSKQQCLDIKQMAKTQDFKIEKTYYSDGVVTSVIQFPAMV